MNTSKILVLSAVVAMFAVTSFAAQPLLSPRAAGNQIKIVPSTVSAASVETASTLLSPRAAGNQIKAVKGIASDVNPAAVCRANMNGTPKAVTECSSHTTMPACVAVAELK